MFEKQGFGAGKFLVPIGAGSQHPQNYLHTVLWAVEKV
jgi:hypothetical protein